MRRAWALTALRLGDDKAASFGVNVRWLRLETMLIVSLLAAVPVAFVGTIGFVGLVGPHIARMLIGEDQRFFLPASVLAGAAMLSLTSVISKSLIPGTIFPSASSRRWSACRSFQPDHDQPEAGMVATLQLNGVGVRYGRQEVLSGVTTPVLKGGEVTAVIGPNAAGKSSLFRRIAGLLGGPGDIAHRRPLDRTRIPRPSATCRRTLP